MTHSIFKRAKFYLARGEAGACGLDCNEWIAAEGKIDLGAAQRLSRLLAKLGNRRPPIFFHSPGGSVPGSIELGRQIRDQKLEVSVAHTIPLGCDRDKPLDKSCEAQKRSGQELEAEFDPAISMCNSACVLVFAGGTTRFVPPGVRLGIHDVGFDPEKPPPRGASLTEAKRVINERILDYLRDMGIDKALLTAASAVPNESVRFLERDEIVRFGIDSREFGETAWHFHNKPVVVIEKRFFVRTDTGDQPRYRNGFVSMNCGIGREIRLAFAQENDSSELRSTVPLSLRIDVNAQRIILRYQTVLRQFDLHWTSLPVDTFDLVSHGANIKVSGIDQGRNNGSAGSVTLNMDGFYNASAKLRRRCDESVSDVIAAAPRAKPVKVPLNLHSKLPEVPNPPAVRSPAVSQNIPAAPVPPAAQDCPTAQSAKLGFVVERGEQQKTEVVHGKDGIVRTVMRYHGTMSLETTQHEGLFQLDRLENGRKTKFEPQTDLNKLFPLEIGQNIGAKFISQSDNGQRGTLSVEMAVKGPDVLYIGPCKYNVLKIERSESSNTGPPRFVDTDYYSPELKLVLAKESRENTGSTHMIKYERIYPLRR